VLLGSVQRVGMQWECNYSITRMVLMVIRHLVMLAKSMCKGNVMKIITNTYDMVQHRAMAKPRHCSFCSPVSDRDFLFL
jgi:hypothetical protein